MKTKLKIILIILVVLFITYVGGWTPIFDAFIEFVSIIFFLGGLILITILIIKSLS